MNIQRLVSEPIKKMAQQYPIVTLVGPRQVGKTTIARELFPDKPYTNLEDPDVREFAMLDTRGFIDQFPDGAIIDEIQRVPKLLSYLQVMVDQKQQNGLYILTGSQQLDLHEAISQSLAGRTALISLLPLSIGELKTQQIELDLDEYLLNGFMPAIYAKSQDAQTFYRSYVGTYIERDIRHMSKVHDLLLFQKFFRLCASRVGQIFSQTNLANEVGVSAATIGNWLSILEASYVIFRIAPYYENFGKRLIKSPKLYFFDVGLVSYLLGIENINQISRDPLRGSIVENLVVLELIKARFNRGLEPNLYFFRDNHGNEVDLVYKRANDLIPIEIKSAKSFDPSFLKGLEYFGSLVGERMSKAFLVYAGKQAYKIEGKFSLVNYKDIATAIS